MEKINIQTETNLLLAKQYIRRNNCSFEIINWALLLMGNGYCSDNLFILAGLDSNDVWNIDLYFKNVLNDLEIDSTIISKEELLDFYLIHHIKRSITNPETLEETISLLAEVIYDTSYYQNEHLNFFFLYDELGENPEEYAIEEYAISEFKAFIAELENE